MSCNMLLSIKVNYSIGLFRINNLKKVFKNKEKGKDDVTAINGRCLEEWIPQHFISTLTVNCSIFQVCRNSFLMNFVEEVCFFVNFGRYSFFVICKSQLKHNLYTYIFCSPHIINRHEKCFFFLWEPLTFMPLKIITICKTNH